MSLNTPTPPLLLTKRLTAFLHANLSPTLHAALLTTVSGKLLAHASSPSLVSSTESSSPSPSASTSGGPAATSNSAAGPRPSPVSLLRTQATVAASLYALHASSSPTIPGALPGSFSAPSSSGSDSPNDSDTLHSATSGTAGHKERKRTSSSGAGGSKPLTITVQLSNGILVIRRLRCGLLFVCVGPLPDQAAEASGSNHVAEGLGGGGGGGNGGLGVPGVTTPRGHGHASPAHMPASPSEASVMSAGGVTTASIASVGSSIAGSVGAAAVVTMRRHAEELARWLDDKLGSLRVPEDGVGVGLGVGAE